MDEPGISVANPPRSASHPVAVPEPPRPVASAARRGRPWMMGGFLLLVVAGVGVAYFLMAKNDKTVEGRAGETSTEARSTTGARLPVEVAHPRQGGIEHTTTQAGSVHAFEHAALYSKIAGYLKVQNVDIGDRVKIGQLLAVIDDPELDKVVDQNKAALDKAKAEVHVAEAQIRSAEAAKQAAEAMVQQAQTSILAKTSNEELQQKQLNRIAGLVAHRAVEDKLQDEQQDRRDVAVADLGMARAEVISAEAAVMEKAALIEQAQADLIEAKANVAVGEADLAKAKVMHDYTRITSPYDGVVTLRSFHRGDFIRSASEGGNVPVLAVARTDLMRVVLPIPDTDVPFANRGDKATLHIVALPGKTFEGTISRFSETEDAESRNMRTEVDIPNKDEILREGMYGRVTVVLQAAAADSMTIPSSGLLGQTGTGEGHVYVVVDEKAHKVEVQVGNDNGIETEILKGLKPADEVIISYNGSITEGTPVKANLKKVAVTAH